jgi:hypothetical protein
MFSGEREISQRLVPHLPLTDGHHDLLTCARRERHFFKPSEHFRWLSGSSRVSEIQLRLFRPSNRARVSDSESDDLGVARRSNRERRVPKVGV